MAKEIDDIEYLILLSLREFRFLMDNYYYHITGLIWRVRNETGIRYESKKRIVSIGFDLNSFEIEIRNRRLLSRSKPVRNYEIIQGENKKAIIDEISANLSERKIENVVKIFANYLKSHLGRVLSGDKWFE